MKYYLVKVENNESPVGQTLLEYSATPYGVELTQEELEFINLFLGQKTPDPISNIEELKHNRTDYLMKYYEIVHNIKDKVRKVLDNAN